MYQQIQQEDASQLRHICLTDMALPADDGVSSFTQLKNQQPATLCYAPPLSTDDTAEILFTSGTTSPTERGGDNSLQPALRWILLRTAVRTA